MAAKKKKKSRKRLRKKFGMSQDETGSFGRGLGDVLAAGIDRNPFDTAPVEESLPAEIEKIQIPQSDLPDEAIKPVAPAKKRFELSPEDEREIDNMTLDELMKEGILSGDAPLSALEGLIFDKPEDARETVQQTLQVKALDKILTAINDDDPDKAMAYMDIFQRGLKEDLSPEFLEADFLRGLEESRAGKDPSFQFTRLGAGTDGVKTPDDVIRSERQELRNLIKTKRDIDTKESGLKLKKAAVASDIATAGLKRDRLIEGFRTVGERKVEMKKNQLLKQLERLEQRRADGQNVSDQQIQLLERNILKLENELIKRIR